MTVSSEQSDVSYDGDGVTLVFPIPFYFLENSDLFVNEVTADGTESPLSLGTDYTVTGAGSQAGGALTLLGSPTPIGKRLLIDRDPPATQETAYQANDPFPAAEHEKALDKLTMLVQRLTRTYFNALHFPLSESTDGTLPQKSARLGMIQGYDPVNGAPIMVPMPASVGAGDLLPYTLVAGVDFNSGDTTVTLPRAPGLSGNVSVFFDAVPRDFDQWSVSGATLTFNAPIPAFVTKIWGYIGTTLSTLLPPNGSIVDAMVAANAAIKATKLSYIPGFTGATTRTVDSKLRDIVSVKDFGAVGDGVADDTAAFNAAIAYANSRGGNDYSGIVGTKILIPTGRYKITAALTPITRSGTDLVGDGWNSTVILLPVGIYGVFTWGDGGVTASPVGGSMKSCKFEYATTPNSSSAIIKIDQAFRLQFSDILLVNIGVFLTMGVTASRICGGVTVDNVTGSVANIASTAVFDMRFGAGLLMTNVALFVAGVLAPVHPANMTTAANRNVFTGAIGFWDTLMVSNCIFERFDNGIVVNAGNGMVYQNFYLSNSIFDYHKSSVVVGSAAAGGVFSTCMMQNCWFVSWEAPAIILTGAGYNDNHLFDGKVVIAGQEAVFYGLGNAKSCRFQLEIGAVNRVATTSNAAMYFLATTAGFHINGCRGNDDNTGVGQPWRAPFGIRLEADCTNFVVTGNRMSGSVSAYTFADNTTPSNSRRVSNNASANYAGISQLFSLPGSGGTFTNSRSFAIDCFIFGGTVSSLAVKGVGIPNMTNGTFRLEPGESFTISYSVAPSFKQLSVA